MPDLHLRTAGLDLHAGKRIMLRHLSWQVSAGERWAIVGRNGAGKSTLLRTLAGLRLPDAGTVFWKERPLQTWPLAGLARMRSYLPQGRRDPFGYTAFEMVMAGRHLAGTSSYWDSMGDREAAMAALDSMDAAHLAQQDVRSLSGGERQRVSLAAVLAQDVRTLLLDEPLTALDLGHRQSVSRSLAKHLGEGERSLVFVSHDLTQVHEDATHVLLLMDDGSWHAGEADTILNEKLLGDCLGHPIEVIHAGQRKIFLASPRNDLCADHERN